MATTVLAPTGAATLHGAGYTDAPKFDVSTVAGAAPQLGDGSDATYVNLGWSGYPTSWSDAAATSCAPVLPQLATVSGIDCTLRGSREWLGGTDADWHNVEVLVGDSNGPYMDASFGIIPMSVGAYQFSGAVGQIETQVCDFSTANPFLLFTMEEVAAALGLPQTVLWVEFSSPQYLSSDLPEYVHQFRIYDLHVAVTGEGATTARPVVRQYPRTDGRGLSSGARLAGRIPTNRIVGGHQ